MAPMRMEHHARATSEGLPPALAREIIQAAGATAHARAQHDCRLLVKDRTAHRRDRQHDVPIDDALVENLAHLTDPVVDIHFGAAQAPGRCAAHRHQVLALPAVQAAGFDVADLRGVAPVEPLGHQAIIVGRLVAWMGMVERLPVIGTELLEDAPIPRGFGHHRVAPSWGDDLVAVQLLYHASPTASTPHRLSSGHSPPPHFTLCYRDFRRLNK